MKTLIQKSMWLGCLCVNLFLAGCSRNSPSQIETGPKTRSVATVHPTRQTVTHIIEQPGRVEAYETTPIHVKIPGYVLKVLVDIGDQVWGPGKGHPQGQLLAELYVPEMDEELRGKKAAIVKSEAALKQAEAAFRLASAHVHTARAQVQEAIAGRLRTRAAYTRWESEFKRLESLARNKVIDEQTRDETWHQVQASAAARDEIEAKIASLESAYKESEARRDAARADVDAAQAHVHVVRADYRRMDELVKYKEVRAPFDGVIVRRMIDTGHFLQPRAGAASDPLFVVARQDIVRVFFEIPETDAPRIEPKMSGTIRIQALGDREIHGRVTRTSWALHPTSRTLRVEFDLKNVGSMLRPGMYAYASIPVKHVNVWTLPSSAVMTEGDEVFCHAVENGKVVRYVLQVGLQAKKVTEVVRKKAIRGGRPTPEWEDFNGQEEIIAVSPETWSVGQEIR
jgi:HlyD family secretion protein